MVNRAGMQCNCSTRVYINRSQFHWTLKLAENLWYRSLDNILSLRISMSQVCSRGVPSQCPGATYWISRDSTSWCWSRFRKAEVDLFTIRWNTHYPLWLSLALQDDLPLRVDAFTHAPWLGNFLFPASHHSFPVERVRLGHLSVIMASLVCHLAPWYAKMTCMLAYKPRTVPYF